MAVLPVLLVRRVRRVLMVLVRGGWHIFEIDFGPVASLADVQVVVWRLLWLWVQAEGVGLVGSVRMMARLRVR